MTKEEKARFKALEKSIGYRFRRREHLRRALTHKSYANELRMAYADHNERLEFLGDAVLELAISHLLMERFTEFPEGELSKLRAAVVNEGQLAEIAREVGLGDYLYLGKGEDQTGGRDKPSLLSDALEAVFGAIYLDRGFGKAFVVIEGLYEDLLERAGGVGFVRDFKTRLQEVSQARFRAVPRYRLASTTGPDHAKTFEVQLFIQDTLWGTGCGASKKAAEQAAASEALAKLESGE
ncbi:MAG: ribonuclease III [Proteobacteria bacterium]|nr:ribonuclease III [Pseudomonadota bacterium]